MEQSLFNEVLSKIDIVKVVSQYVSLKKEGRDYVGVCPFHDDTNPSFHVSPTKNIFKCFVCNEGGDAVKFIQKVEKCDFKTAFNKAVDIMDFPKDYKLAIKETPTYDPYSKEQRRMIQMNEAIQKYMHYSIHTNADGCFDYIKKRGIDDKCVDTFGFGYLDKSENVIHFLQKKYGYTIEEMKRNDFFRYSEKHGLYSLYEHRITFPIYDNLNNLIGFAGRKTDAPTLTDGKYINPSTSDLFEKGKVLYNLYNAKTASRLKKRLYIVEGYMDAIAMANHGYDNVVALMGVALTQQHIQLLKQIKDSDIVFMLDGDRAGMDNMHRIYKQLAGEGLKVHFVSLPDGKDPDDMFKTDEQEMSLLLENYMYGYEFEVSYYKNQIDESMSFRRKKEVIKEMVHDFILEDYDYLDKAHFVTLLSENYGLDVESVKNYYVASEKEIRTIRKEDKIKENSEPVREVLNSRYGERSLGGSHRKKT